MHADHSFVVMAEIIYTNITGLLRQLHLMSLSLMHMASFHAVLVIGLIRCRALALLLGKTLRNDSAAAPANSAPSNRKDTFHSPQFKSALFPRRTHCTSGFAPFL